MHYHWLDLIMLDILHRANISKYTRANTPQKLPAYTEFGFFCLHQNINDTNSASWFGSASIELKKELNFLKQNHKIQRVVQGLPLLFLTVSCTAILSPSHFIELPVLPAVKVVFQRAAHDTFM